MVRKLLVTGLVGAGIAAASVATAGSASAADDWTMVGTYPTYDECVNNGNTVYVPLGWEFSCVQNPADGNQWELWIGHK